MAQQVTCSTAFSPKSHVEFRMFHNLKEGEEKYGRNFNWKAWKFSKKASQKFVSYFSHPHKICLTSSKGGRWEKVFQRCLFKFQEGSLKYLWACSPTPRGHYNYSRIKNLKAFTNGMVEPLKISNHNSDQTGGEKRTFFR